MKGMPETDAQIHLSISENEWQCYREATAVSNRYDYLTGERGSLIGRAKHIVCCCREVWKKPVWKGL
jgi:hypothetical protein